MRWNRPAGPSASGALERLRAKPAQLLEALERALHDPGLRQPGPLLAVHLARGERARQSAVGEPGCQQGGRDPRRVGDGRVEPAGVGGQVLAPGSPCAARSLAATTRTSAPAPGRGTSYTQGHDDPADRA